MMPEEWCRRSVFRDDLGDACFGEIDKLSKQLSLMLSNMGRELARTGAEGCTVDMVQARIEQTS